MRSVFLCAKIYLRAGRSVMKVVLASVHHGAHTPTHGYEATRAAAMAAFAKSWRREET